MKTVITPFIEKNGWKLEYKWRYRGRSNQGNIEYCEIFLETSPGDFLKIGQFERDSGDECLILYYRLPWIVINNIYKHLDKEGEKNDI